MTGLGVADAEAASETAADAEADSLGAVEAVAAASLVACWPQAASRAQRLSITPLLNIARRVRKTEVMEIHSSYRCEV